MNSKPRSRRQFVRETALAAAAAIGVADGEDQAETAAPGPVRTSDAGQWWQYRRDRRLSGHTGARGAIVTPVIRWSYPVAAREHLLAASPGTPGPRRIALPGHDSALPPAATWEQLQEKWRLADPYGYAWFDLDGTGALSPVSRSYNQKVGKILPGEPGLQRVETEAKGYPKVPGVYKGTVRLSVRHGGAWTPRWEVETPTLIWQPSRSSAISTVMAAMRSL